MVLRISNPKTLQRWIDTGEYQSYLDAGYIFNVGCGRFKLEPCTCRKCRTRTRPLLQEILDKYHDNDSKIEIKKEDT